MNISIQLDIHFLAGSPALGFCQFFTQLARIDQRMLWIYSRRFRLADEASKCLVLPPYVLWVGVSWRNFSLLPCEMRRLQLTAKVSCLGGGGVFEVNSLSVKAAPSSSPNSEFEQQAPFVRQLCDFSSLVVVLPHSLPQQTHLSWLHSSL